jgi:beta-cyano-L-alanine hydratase/nitrilase
MCIKPSNKSEKLVTEAANQGSQLVIFPNTFVSGYPRGNAFGIKLATGHKNYHKKLKT